MIETTRFRRPSIWDIAALAVVVLLPLGVLAVARAYTVNVGYYDDWVWSWLIAAMRHGELLWGNMWRLHNNHRIFFPDLVALGLAQAGAWSLPRETMFSVATAAFTQGVWFAVVTRLVPVTRRTIVTVAISLLIFSLAQGENWVWGFQIAWFIANLAIAVTVYALTCRDSVGLSIGAMVAAVIAAHSVAYGLNMLLAGLAVALASRRRRPWEIAAWSILVVAIFLDYVHDYTKGLALAPQMSAPERVVQTLIYAAAFLGSPLTRSFGVVVCAIAGVLLIVAYAYAVFRWWRLRVASPGDAERLVVPLALAIVPILTALQIAWGRLWEGMPTSLAGRYVTASSLLVIALLIAAALGPFALPRRRAVVASAAAAFVACWCANQLGGLSDIRTRACDIFAAAQALPHYHTSATEDEVARLWPGELVVPLLESLHDGPFATRVTSH